MSSTAPATLTSLPLYLSLHWCTTTPALSALCPYLSLLLTSFRALSMWMLELTALSALAQPSMEFLFRMAPLRFILSNIVLWMLMKNIIISGESTRTLNVSAPHLFSLSRVSAFLKKVVASVAFYMQALCRFYQLSISTHFDWRHNFFFFFFLYYYSCNYFYIRRM